MCEELPTIFKGQGIEEKPNAMHQLVLTILKDEAKTSYENAVRAACETTENGPRIFPTRDIINEGLAKVKELVMPVGARRKQAAYLRRHLGKPASMSVVSYVHRIQVLSRYLRFFPGSRGSLPEDEVVEIIATSIPQKWQMELTRLQFRFETATISCLREFLERLEICEGLTGNSPNQARSGRKGSRP